MEQIFKFVFSVEVERDKAIEVEFKSDICRVWWCINPNKVFDAVFILFILKIEFVDKLFKLLNIVFDVEFKLLIDVVFPLILNIEFVDNEFKLLNIVVEVVFILFILNIEFVDKLFKFVVVANTDTLVPVDNIVVVVVCIESSSIKVAI